MSFDVIYKLLKGDWICSKAWQRICGTIISGGDNCICRQKIAENIKTGGFKICVMVHHLVATAIKRRLVALLYGAQFQFSKNPTVENPASRRSLVQLSSRRIRTFTLECLKSEEVSVWIKSKTFTVIVFPKYSNTKNLVQSRLFTTASNLAGFFIVASVCP